MIVPSLHADGFGVVVTASGDLMLISMFRNSRTWARGLQGGPPLHFTLLAARADGLTRADGVLALERCRRLAEVEFP